MHKALELWQFVAHRLRSDQNVMLLVVAESSGSSPGRQGYKMAVGADGQLYGSIGGGVMEVNLVEQCRSRLLEPGAAGTGLTEQVHQKASRNASGMICSGKQTIIFKLLTSGDLSEIEATIASIARGNAVLTITPELFSVGPRDGGAQGSFEMTSDTDFRYIEFLGYSNDLYIVGGGHCALALSDVMSKMDFRIHIFDDRPELNTIEKNQFADEIKIIDSYDTIADHIESSPNAYVVVMTLGYAHDKIVIEKLVDKEFKYFGVLGSKAKMATLLKELKADGYNDDKLKRIHTPIGIPINSRTPDEIAVSIAAEIISVKNG